ncbi:MAG: porin [Rubrivivax sp.]|nr:porin [Rubrivivax sp.]
MKKSLLALAALTAFAGVASAQSSVTLFGIVDLSVNSVKNGSVTQKLMSSNQLNSNRLGFRGVEDLGGGMKAGFWIEGGMDNDTGGTGQTWQRRSTVSLMGGFGEIRLGRDYTATFWNYTFFDPFGTNGLGNVLNTVSTLSSGATTLVRANNTVSYFLPAMGGLYGQLQVAAGEGIAGNKYLGGRIGYAAGPLNVAGAWGKTEKDGAMIDDYTDMNFGASYNMGFMTLMGQYSKREYSTRDSKSMLLGMTVPMGSGTLKASYVKSSGTSVALTPDLYDATQIAIGYQYDLSKRTALYGTYSRVNNDGNAVTGAKFTVGSGVPMTIGGETSSGYNVGIRHSF